MKSLYAAGLTLALLLTACGPASDNESKKEAVAASDALCLEGICYAETAADFVARLPTGTDSDVAEDDGMSYVQLLQEVDVDGLDFMVNYVRFDVSPERAKPVNMVIFMREDVNQDIENCEAAVSGLAGKLAAKGVTFTPGPHRHSFVAAEDYPGVISNTQQVNNEETGVSLTTRDINFDGARSSVISTQSMPKADGTLFQIEAVNADGNCDIFMSMSDRPDYGTYDLLSEF